ncbi:hypothetical protein DVJ78_16390 [Humibacter sp. BT305]|nr:hypothetical protein DVJ78_16390 [Humibacter sp. BT305]
MRSEDEIRREYVQPFYRAVRAEPSDPEVLRALARTAVRADTAEVLAMLRRDEWRHQRMGAWFSLVKDDRRLDEALIAGVRESRGLLTAPDLAVALTRKWGEAAVPTLIEYQVRASEAKLGRQGFVSALIELHGGRAPLDPSEERDRRWVSHLTLVATTIERAAAERRP